ncbi:hypothetical protein KKC1_20160 [Calderihabitans maritimus]|uniref:Uncharacterized protein n=1 Tax=Calderihabitans maritimus TaxID=1246530 RepID=A0A1Z5HTX3_9FIRM|nr:hypothetical protein KKC1_20160 [Calderihabitans maritimus]
MRRRLKQSPNKNKFDNYALIWWNLVAAGALKAAGQKR